jgi:predicted amidophosphoribosyltransferase
MQPAPFLTTLVDWCFPPRAHELLVRTISLDDLQPTPHYPAPQTHCLFPFHHSTIQALVHEAKFFYNRRAQQLVGAALGHHLLTHWPEATYVPIPLHPARERERGFNQVTACLLTHAHIRPALQPQLLRRNRATQPQSRLTGRDRAANVSGAFSLNALSGHQLAADTTLVLIDDVYTTGATVAAAAMVLTSNLPNPVYTLTFAYA